MGFKAFDKILMFGRLSRVRATTLKGGCIVDKELFSEQVQIERKLFSFDLRENPRGRFLKVTEDVGGRRDTVIMPATGLEQVRDIINRALNASNEAGPCDTSNTD